MVNSIMLHSTPTRRSVIICLFRHDLRIRDNPILHYANSHPTATHMLPVYCFDPRQVNLTRARGKDYAEPKSRLFNLPRSSKLRTRFLVESVLNLKTNLKKLGSELLIALEPPEEFLPRVADELLPEYDVEAVYLQEEVTDEEIRVQQKLIHRMNAPVESFHGATLVHPEDLPFPMEDLPDVYTKFRKAVESMDTPFRPVLPTPKKLKPLPGNDLLDQMLTVDADHLLPSMGVVDTAPDLRTVFPFGGGEDQAIERLTDWVWNTKSISTYKETRNGLLGTDYSSKLSPWLALGCLSPREILKQVEAYEDSNEANVSTYWIRFELLWRDYFWFVGGKYGNGIFHRDGVLANRSDDQPSWKVDPNLMKAWIHGETGIPWVDANMRELRNTGYMSNRGRQNVASFLAKDLRVDWRFGGEWFETHLLDYDPCSNYGNWQYGWFSVAGVGNDPRENRHFNMIKQAKDYDPEGKYVAMWCPELRDVPVEHIHTPWKMPHDVQQKANCVIGRDYPEPIVLQEVWEKHVARPPKDTKKSSGNPNERVSKKDSRRRQRRKAKASKPHSHR
ncbi:cryptochrome [Basidiobolus meristosporus CBS 931.73]|uniref:Cryptochrome DASH n=1 Tax=Basidiobolus meristosporus CBS 931.73 TaxID=1314790 RepID=A0A1Y1XWV8_9FUNG|nr:cryptochrome [Basidiobolus meristosporus CBS 931.73]|eukprot:ORX90230.1 cryptochrome [Basidiobolus meristosporus CBS 931.73]